jgi:hypothetical protein
LWPISSLTAIAATVIWSTLYLRPRAIRRAGLRRIL